MTEQERKDNQARATKRAQAEIRRDLLSIEADRMLTLTYRENMTDRGRAIADIMRFNRSMRTRFENWQSVTVLEWQERGAAHFHLGISGFYDVHVVRDIWRGIVGEGNIDIRFKPDGRGNCYSKLAAYMGKYLGKDLDQGRKAGEHRYFRCNVGQKAKQVYYIPATAPLGIEKELYLEVIQTALRLGAESVCGIWCSGAGIGGSGYASGEVSKQSNGR